MGRKLLRSVLNNTFQSLNSSDIFKFLGFRKIVRSKTICKIAPRKVRLTFEKLLLSIKVSLNLQWNQNKVKLTKLNFIKLN